MGDKRNLWKDATSNQWGTAEMQAKIRTEKKGPGSYDRNGKLIEGTAPPKAPKKPVAGSYDRKGKLIRAMTGQTK